MDIAIISYQAKLCLIGWRIEKITKTYIYSMGPQMGNCTFFLGVTFKACTLGQKDNFGKVLIYNGLIHDTCISMASLCHSNGHIETMPAREINPFTALTRIRSQFLRTQWSTSNHSEWTRLRLNVYIWLLLRQVVIGTAIWAEFTNMSFGPLKKTFREIQPNLSFGVLLM